MDESIIKDTTALRDKAWQTLSALPEFVAFRVLNDAVKAMGGESKAEFSNMLAKLGSPLRPLPAGGGTAGNASFVRRISQGDATEKLLREAGHPKTGAELLKGAQKLGVTISGDNPAANFTSSLSRDKRFYSFRYDGQYVWWLRGVELPTNMNEAEPAELPGLNGSASSHSSSQEGGEANAATTTN